MCHVAISWEMFSCLNLAKVVDQVRGRRVGQSHPTIALLDIVSSCILLRLIQLVGLLLRLRSNLLELSLRMVLVMSWGRDSIHRLRLLSKVSLEFRQQLLTCALNQRLWHILS